MACFESSKSASSPFASASDHHENPFRKEVYQDDESRSLGKQRDAEEEDRAEIMKKLSEHDRETIESYRRTLKNHGVYEMPEVQEWLDMELRAALVSPQGKREVEDEDRTEIKKRHPGDSEAGQYICLPRPDLVNLGWRVIVKPVLHTSRGKRNWPLHIWTYEDCGPLFHIPEKPFMKKPELSELVSTRAADENRCFIYPTHHENPFTLEENFFKIQGRDTVGEETGDKLTHPFVKKSTRSPDKNSFRKKLYQGHQEKRKSRRVRLCIKGMPKRYYYY